MRNLLWKRFGFGCALILLCGFEARAQTAPHQLSPMPSFRDFDRRARVGAHLNVVFFGASLTWGANASDPQQTSYRADVARRFETTYPKAHFKFWDAAVGGTGSQLGVFRLQRDVLSHHPDLVFLDFSANDDIYSADAETLASYESLVRRIIIEGKCPLVQVIFPFKWNVESGDLPKMQRRSAHYEIARAYNTSVGDAILLAQERIKNGDTTLQKIWPIDGVHPGDIGYQLFADAAWSAFQKAVTEKVECRAPAKMLNAATYMTWKRARISQLGALPVGWSVGAPNRISAYFDFLMSRWLDDEVIATNRRTVSDAEGKTQTVPQQVERLKVNFRGSMVMLLGEVTLQSGKYRAYIDGQLVQRTQDGKTLTEYDPGAFARTINGNGHHVQVLAHGLDVNATHTLEIEPVFAVDSTQELRLESICVAGADSFIALNPD